MSTETHHHPEPKDYVRIALVLAALTGAEVGLFYLEAGVEQVTQTISVPALILLSALKFYLVVALFMHLRYEKRLLSRFFTTGAVLAVCLYLILLVALGAVAFS
jgi:cytochrome c oxidase subunit 4